VSYPTAIAFDTYGNSYVANAGTWAITVYSHTGAPNTAATITSGVRYPTGVVVDGMDDVWVENDAQSFNVYDLNGNLMNTNNTGEVINMIAIHGGWAVVGLENDAYTLDLSGQLLIGNFVYSTVHTQAANAAAIDDSGAAYVATTDQLTGQPSITAYTAHSIFPFSTFDLGYTPAGIAIDSARQRAYISSNTLNKIEVYSVASSNFGTLLYTIH